MQVHAVSFVPDFNDQGSFL